MSLSVLPTTLETDNNNKEEREQSPWKPLDEYFFIALAPAKN